MKEEINIGDSVRVKPGMFDPDFEKYDMSGWQGRVAHKDFEESEFLEIDCDSITLDQMPHEFIERSLEEESL